MSMYMRLCFVVGSMCTLDCTPVTPHGPPWLNWLVHPRDWLMHVGLHAGDPARAPVVELVGRSEGLVDEPFPEQGLAVAGDEGELVGLRAELGAFGVDEFIAPRGLELLRRHLAVLDLLPVGHDLLFRRVGPPLADAGGAQVGAVEDLAHRLFPGDRLPFAAAAHPDAFHRGGDPALVVHDLGARLPLEAGDPTRAGFSIAGDYPDSLDIRSLVGVVRGR